MAESKLSFDIDAEINSLRAGINPFRDQMLEALLALRDCRKQLDMRTGVAENLAASLGDRDGRLSRLAEIWLANQGELETGQFSTTIDLDEADEARKLLGLDKTP